MTSPSEQIKLQFGTEPRKMRRNTDPETSHEAAEQIDSTQLESLVYHAIAAFGEEGCIGDDVCRVLAYTGKGVQTLSPRYAPLIRKGYIYRAGDKRQGSGTRKQMVMRVNRRKVTIAGSPKRRHDDE